jgi:hypothetical protein
MIDIGSFTLAHDRDGFTERSRAAELSPSPAAAREYEMLEHACRCMHRPRTACCLTCTRAFSGLSFAITVSCEESARERRGASYW